MSTYTKILYQIVFGSKDITPFISRENQIQLFAYMAGILKNKNCFPYIVGGYGNHIHIVVSLHPSIPLAELVKVVKTYSNRFMKNRKSQYNTFSSWQVGYGAFTYDVSSKNRLVNYVKNQESHHQKKSYKEELIEFLKEFGIDYNEEELLL